MNIRKSTEKDLPRMMEIFAHAREFMAAHGNPRQWGPTRWPPQALIERDIELQHIASFELLCIGNDDLSGLRIHVR